MKRLFDWFKAQINPMNVTVYTMCALLLLISWLQEAACKGAVGP